MKRSMVWLAVVLVLLALGTFFVFSRDVESRAYSEEDAGKTIEIAVGESIRIELEENPSTGFGWYCTIDQERVITPDSDQFFPAETKNLVGAAGKHEFIFRAVEEGNAQITFNYYRPWEPENIAERYVFNFAVK